MNKSELIQTLSEQTGLSKVDTEKTLSALMETIMDTVAKGEDVALMGFGTFKAAHRAAREGRNPATGETLKIAASKQPKFVPGTPFKNKVNGK